MTYKSYLEFEKAKMNNFRAQFGVRGYFAVDEAWFKQALREAVELGIEAGKVGEKMSLCDTANIRNYYQMGYNSAISASEKAAKEFMGEEKDERDRIRTAVAKAIDGLAKVGEDEV